MKLTTIILITTLLQVSAASFGQKVTLVKNNVSISQVFNEIRKQTGYGVVAPASVLRTSEKVNVNFKEASLATVIDFLLKDKDLSYTIEDRTVVIEKNEASFMDKITARFQAIDVRGRVVDAEGNPLVGASVTVKGGRGTTTDKDGEFYLAKVDEKAVLVISFIGYLTREVNANAELSAIALEVANSKLDEVQIMAYGTTSRRLSTGNITTIKAGDIQKAPSTNPLLAIQGRTPGLFIKQSTGFANSGVTAQIQGRSSINSGSDPLYVIDGIPYVPQLLPSLNGGTLGAGGNGSSGSPLSFINSKDIESIDVLKGADATSIYGSRGANGVIVLTTKTGRSGETKVDVGFENSWATASSRMRLLNTKQYLEMRQEAKANNSAPITNGQYGDLDLVYYSQDQYTDWQKVLLGGVAKTTDLRGSVSGGSSNTQFLISGDYHRENTILPADLSDTKGTFHFNLNHKTSNDKLKIQFIGSYQIDENKLPSGDITADIFLAPNSPSLFMTDGKTLNWEVVKDGDSEFLTFNNPLASLYSTHTIGTRNLISSINLSYQLIDGLRFKTTLGYNYLQSNEVKENPVDIYPSYLTPFLIRTGGFGNTSIKSYTIEPQLTYYRKIGKGGFDLLLGSSIHRSDENGILLEASGFNSDLVLSNLAAATAIKTTGATINTYKYNGLFGRVTYNYDDKYVLNLNARRDGSSRFGPKNQLHNFASAGAAWILTNEKFIKDNLSFLSFGKVRASFGTTGNDQISNYKFLIVYGDAYDLGVPYQNIKGLSPLGPANPYIQWEETKKTELGVDFGFFKDRILIGFNYNVNRSSNQLLEYILPYTTGATSITKNFPAIIQNTGLEFSLTSSNLRSRDFKWTTSFNLTIPNNKLLSFPDLTTSSYAERLVIGEPLSIIKLFDFKGVDLSTGLNQFAKEDGTNVSNPNPSTDKSILITPDPKFYGAFSHTLTYKSLSLDFLFRFVKQISRNVNYVIPPGIARNQPINVLERWQKPGDITSVQKFDSNYSFYESFNAASESNAAWSDATLLRLQNVSLSFQMPEDFSRSLSIRNLRVYVQGQNLVTFSSYKGLDPETGSSITLPSLRTVTAGIQISL